MPHRKTPHHGHGYESDSSSESEYEYYEEEEHMPGRRDATLELSKDELLELFSLMASNVIKKPHNLHITGLGPHPHTIKLEPVKLMKPDIRRALVGTGKENAKQTAKAYARPAKHGSGKLTPALKNKLIARYNKHVGLGMPHLGRGLEKDIAYYSTFSKGPSLGSSPPATNVKDAGIMGHGVRQPSIKVAKHIPVSTHGKGSGKSLGCGPKLHQKKKFFMG